VHQPAAHDLAAEVLADRLVAEAHAEQRAFLGGAGGDQVEADTRLVRRAGAGRDQEALRTAGEGFGRGQRIVAHHFHLGAQFHDVMDQVPGEAVVIVDDEDHDEPAFARFSTTIKGPIGKPLSSRPLAGSHSDDTVPSRNSAFFTLSSSR